MPEYAQESVSIKVIYSASTQGVKRKVSVVTSLILAVFSVHRMKSAPINTLCKATKYLHVPSKRTPVGHRRVSHYQKIVSSGPYSRNQHSRQTKFVTTLYKRHPMHLKEIFYTFPYLL